MIDDTGSRFVCECADPGCECLGKCAHQGRSRVFRIDMEDISGTLMCSACAEDALDTGIFATEAEGGTA